MLMTPVSNCVGRNVALLGSEDCGELEDLLQPFRWIFFLFVSPATASSWAAAGPVAIRRSTAPEQRRSRLPGFGA